MGADKRGKPITAPSIESCDTIWSDEKSALPFATAKPATVGTHSHIGVLFLLIHHHDGCRIAGLLRFTAMGKDSGLSAKLTAFAAIKLSSDGFEPVVTVNESQGDRGYSYEICASYKFTGSKLKRVDLQ